MCLVESELKLKPKQINSFGLVEYFLSLICSFKSSIELNSLKLFSFNLKNISDSYSSESCIICSFIAEGIPIEAIFGLAWY